MPTLVVHLEAHVVARGVWCDRCLLPSAVTVVVALRDNPTRTVSRMRSCADCRQTVRLT